eukprot:COSAG01_NODE_7833_length_3035_cov_1.938351_7_plen_40_part_00
MREREADISTALQEAAANEDTMHRRQRELKEAEQALKDA